MKTFLKYFAVCLAVAVTTSLIWAAVLWNIEAIEEQQLGLTQPKIVVTKEGITTYAGHFTIITVYNIFGVVLRETEVCECKHSPYEETPYRDFEDAKEQLGDRLGVKYVDH